MVAIASQSKKSETNTYSRERGKPIPSLKHSLLQSELIFLQKKENSEKFTIASELSLDFMPKDATPDICIYPKMEIDMNSEEDVVKMTEPPLTTIEILSPTQLLNNVISKIRQIYFTNGVQSSWVIIPSMKAVVLYLPGHDLDGYQLFKSGEMNDPVTGIKLNVKDIFNVG